MIGAQIGSYRVLTEIGVGGMGVVYKGEHDKLQRPAAIKMLLPSLSQDPSIVQRFFNEAKAASAIDHPGIVEIYDVGQHTDGSAYIVMAFLRGENLQERLDRGDLSLEAGLQIMEQVCAGLAAAHKQSIVHRDLKPDNIFLIPNDMLPGGQQVKILDFGIAKLAGDPAAGLKTQTGTLMGTPAYMSPEQCKGVSTLDHRTDLYSLGCIMFHIACGRPPFLSEHGSGVMIASHIRDEPPDPRTINPQIPPPVSAVILRLLKKDPYERFQNADDLRQAIKRCLELAKAPQTKQMEFAATVMPDDEAYSAADVQAYMAAQGVAATLPPSSGQAPGSQPPSGHDSFAQPRPGQGPPAAQYQQPYNQHHGQSPGSQPPAESQQVHHHGSAVNPAHATGQSTQQAMAAPPTNSRPQRNVSKGAVFAALGGVLVLGAAAAVVVATSADKDSGQPTDQTSLSSEAHTSMTSAQQSAGALSSTLATNPCPDGKTRRSDTHGHCCWPDQAWSLTKQTCVGSPTCPSDKVAKGADCIGKLESLRLPPSLSSRQAKTSSAGKTSSAITVTKTAKISLSDKFLPAGKTVDIKFSRRVNSPTGARAWVTIVKPSAADSKYAKWTYIPDQSRSVKLKTPSVPGEYEVRLHTDYPKKSYNVVHRVPVIVEGKTSPGSASPNTSTVSAATPRSKQRFKLYRTDFRSGKVVTLSFPEPMVALPGERFWATIIKDSAPDSSWAKYEYVPANARKLRLRAPTTPGTYEVRLHGNYPTKTTNVVHRKTITVH